MDERDVKRFRSFVDVRGSDECWPWTGPLVANGDGYGVFSAFRTEGRKLRAHRVSYQLLNGPIPNGLHVRHTCDNPTCVNPNHLVLGTNAENMRDKVVRDRHYKAFGETNVRCKLSDLQCDDIRRRYDAGERVFAIHKDYPNVSYQCVRDVAKRFFRVNGSEKIRTREWFRDVAKR